MKIVRASSLDRHDRNRFNELRRGDADAVVEKEFNEFIESIRGCAGLSFRLNYRGSCLTRRTKRCDDSNRSS